MSLKNKKSSDLEVSATNEEGIPCYSGDSEALRHEHDKWREALNNRQGRRVEEWRYWRQMSNCKAL